MINILLLGVGGNVSQGILKALRRSSIEMWIVGACISPMSSGLYMCDEALLSPYANDPDFMPWLIEVCNEKQIDIILTGVEENIFKIVSEIKVLESKTNAVFIASDYEKLTIGGDKFLTCEWLENNGLNYPHYSLTDDIHACRKLVSEVGYPLIMKPRNGKSSRGVFKITNEQELEEILGTKDGVLQECIGDERHEYTVGCYCDKNGLLQGMIVMRRNLKNGSTAYANVEQNDSIIQEVKKICDVFKPKGPFNVQLRIDQKGRPVPFEFNVRFSGTTAIRSVFGFRDVEAMLKEYILDERITDCFQVKKGQVFRYEEELYVFDEAVVEMTERGYIEDIKEKKIYKSDEI